MLSDRRSLYDGWGLTRDEALAMEMRHGLAVLDVGRQGAERFASGAGRGGGDS
jgi:enoyl-CoA hydratase